VSSAVDIYKLNGKCVKITGADPGFVVWGQGWGVTKYKYFVTTLRYFFEYFVM